jgi:hypothetical protein
MVFKYQTDELVSTVSWKLLSLEPYNHDWQPAFAELYGPAKASFQELTIHDVTWSLDPRFPPGKRGDYVGVGGRGAAGGAKLNSNWQPPIFNREMIRVRIITRKLPDGPPGDAFPLRLPKTQVLSKLDILVPKVRYCSTTVGGTRKETFLLIFSFFPEHLQVHVWCGKEGVGVTASISDAQLVMLKNLVNEIDAMVTSFKQKATSSSCPQPLREPPPASGQVLSLPALLAQKYQILTRRKALRSKQKANSSCKQQTALREHHAASGQVLTLLACWYKSTNTDTEEETPVLRKHHAASGQVSSLYLLYSLY